MVWPRSVGSQLHIYVQGERGRNKRGRLSSASISDEGRAAVPGALKGSFETRSPPGRGEPAILKGFPGNQNGDNEWQQFQTHGEDLASSCGEVAVLEIA